MRNINHARRTAAALAAGGLLGGILVAVGTAPAMAQTLDKTRTYKCHVIAGGVDLKVHNVGVRTVVDAPDSVVPGDTIPTRKTQITLTLPESLRAATYGLVGGRSAEGGSTNTDLTFEFPDGQGDDYRITDLESLEPVNIPATAGSPWRVPAEGDVPAVTVPSNVWGGADVLLPKAFLVNATVYKGLNGTGDTVPATMDCVISQSTASYRLLGSVPVITENAPPVAAPVKVSTKYAAKVAVNLAGSDPDTPAGDLVYSIVNGPRNGTLTGTGKNRFYTPKKNFAGTDTFTYRVTDENPYYDTATVTVTVAKTTSTTTAKAPKTAKAGKPVKVAVNVKSAATATGNVTVKLGAKKVAAGKVKNGKATVTIPGAKTKKLKGKKSFTVVFAGSSVVAGSSGKFAVKFKK